MYGSLEIDTGQVDVKDEKLKVDAFQQSLINDNKLRYVQVRFLQPTTACIEMQDVLSFIVLHKEQAGVATTPNSWAFKKIMGSYYSENGYAHVSW